MPVYYKRFWEEDRGDEHAQWGTSWWYFEVGVDGFPIRQMEVYQAGFVLKYDESHQDDEFGMLSGASLDPEEFASCAISAEEFEKEWTIRQPFNQ